MLKTSSRKMPPKKSPVKKSPVRGKSPVRSRESVRRIALSKTPEELLQARATDLVRDSIQYISTNVLPAASFIDIEPLVNEFSDYMREDLGIGYREDIADLKILRNVALAYAKILFKLNNPKILGDLQRIIVRVLAGYFEEMKARDE